MVDVDISVTSSDLLSSICDLGLNRQASPLATEFVVFRLQRYPDAFNFDRQSMGPAKDH